MNQSNWALIASSLLIALTGCASKPSEMPTAYVSPLKYKDYDCDQIVMEMDYVSNRTTTLYTNLNKKASDDSAQMAVGMIIFWPALFFLEGGDGPEAAEYSTLKGEFEALRQAAIKKKCDKEMIPESPTLALEKQMEEEKRKKEAQEESNL